MSFLPPAAGTQYCPFAKNGKGEPGGRPNPVSFSAEGGGLAISQAAKTPVSGAKNCVKTQIMLNLTHALTQFLFLNWFGGIPNRFGGLNWRA